MVFGIICVYIYNLEYVVYSTWYMAISNNQGS